MKGITERYFVRMFQPRFAGMVETFQKRQTVRKRPKRMPRKGDTLSCREWTGLPYRSKQRELAEVILTNVHSVKIRKYDLIVAGQWMGAEQRERFARADGFEDWEDLQGWFEAAHGLPFEGIVIFW